MPLYDWECESCHHQFEEVTSSTETVCQCPNCGMGAFKIITKIPLMSYSNRPKERPWGSAHWRSDKKKGGEK
jgi:putative FmdB family regulatory protein